MSSNDCFSRIGLEILNKKQLDFTLSLLRSCITNDSLQKIKEIDGLKADQGERM